jgi:hypothetical protein
VTVAGMTRPDEVFVQAAPEDSWQRAVVAPPAHGEAARWDRAGARIGWTGRDGSGRLTLAATSEVSRVALRWHTAWERTYGDVSWDGVVHTASWQRIPGCPRRCRSPRS